MIKFFRRIRYGLMEKNKTGKYFKYAIGEIVLVVIGILIALSINNWNENRLKSNKEALILENIHKEFVANKKQLDTVVFYHRRIVESCEKLISKFPIDIKNEELDSISFFLGGVFAVYTFNPLQASVTSLTNTSTFDIIKNRELRDLLISWNDLVKDYQEEEIQIKEYQNAYNEFFNKNFDYGFNLRDKRTNLEILQTFEFENKIQDRHDTLKEIVEGSGELQILYNSIDDIIKLTSQTDFNEK
jgi:hypothetical protein